MRDPATHFLANSRKFYNRGRKIPWNLLMRKLCILCIENCLKKNKTLPHAATMRYSQVRMRLRQLFCFFVIACMELQFLVEIQLGQQIDSDVTHFLQWAKEHLVQYDKRKSVQPSGGIESHQTRKSHKGIIISNAGKGDKNGKCVGY